MRRRVPAAAVRFLVDESLGRDAVRVLRQEGWDAKFVDELNLARKDDQTVFAKAWKLKRVIVTHDRDFLDNQRFPFYRNPGVVVFTVGASGGDDERLLHAFTYMQFLLKVFGAAYMRGTKIVFSDDEHVTIERRVIAGRLVTTRYWVPRKGPAMQWIE